MKTKKIISLVLASCLIFGNIAFAAQHHALTKRPKAKAKISKQVKSSSVYTNKKYGFSVNIPSSWKNNYVVKERYNVNDYGNIKVLLEVNFVFSPAKCKEDDKQNIITFYVISKNTWNKMKKSKDEPIGAYLGAKNNLVYLFRTPQSNPLDSNSKNGKLFDSMYGAFQSQKNILKIK